jgi:hypothetical protein
MALSQSDGSDISGLVDDVLTEMLRGNMFQLEDRNVLRVDNLLPLDELSPGLFGYTLESGGALYVPLVVARPPGRGALSRYLNALPRDRVVKFPSVLSSILERALLKRGFHVEYEWSDEHDERVEMYVRRP